jgi:hypothetical protein
MAVADHPDRARPADVPVSDGRHAPATADWPAQAADQVVHVVDQVRVKTVGPATKAARGAVFGLLAAVLGTTILILAFIALVRGMTELFEWLLPWGGVWLTYLVLGVVLLLAGFAVFRRRYPPGGRPTT